MMKLPEKIPADPTPAIARPTINATDEGATPHIRDPSSKIRMEMTYGHLRLKRTNIRPQSSWNEHAVRKYPDPYHPTSWIEWNCLVICGIAVEIIVVSCEHSKSAN